MKMYCYDCDKDVSPVIKDELRNYDFRNKNFDVKIKAFYCPFCKNELINDALDEQLNALYSAYLKTFNLYLDSFKYIRSSYNLTQDLFAKVLGFSKRSIIRYENSEEIPQGEYLNTYVKLNENHDYILECLNLNKKNLTPKEYQSVLSRLQLDINIKARNAILYILDNNPLFVLQLIKNMFAVDFLNYKNNGLAITNFKYIKMEYGPVIDGYKDIVNTMIKTGEIKISDVEVVNDVERFKYIAVHKFNEGVFTKEEFKVLKEVKKKLKNQSGTSLSEWSHLFKGWIETPLGKTISYEYAKDFDW